MSTVNDSITVYGAQAVTVVVSITSGASISAGTDLSTARLARVDMPAAWSAANLTFQLSDDNVTYLDLYDSAGTEYVVTAAASRAILIPLVDFLGARYMKVRSGSTGTPVVQGASRSLVLQLVP